MTALQQFLSAANVAVLPEKLEHRLHGIDVSVDGGAQKFAQALTVYLTQDAAVPDQQASAIMTSGEALLATAIERSASESGADGGDLEAGSNGGANGTIGATGSVKIEDVHAWKASLQSSAGPRPVRDLSEFEDFDAKL